MQITFETRKRNTGFYVLRQGVPEGCSSDGYASLRERETDRQTETETEAERQSQREWRRWGCRERKSHMRKRKQTVQVHVLLIRIAS